VASTWWRLLGLAVSALYGAFVVWLYAAQPRTLVEVRGGVAASVGVYAIDHTSFEEGLRFFRTDRFVEARAAFARADPAQRDAPTQFYIAYTFLRQGWGRFYHDDALYREGQAALARAVHASPSGVVRVDDAGLGLKTSDELGAELTRGLTRDASDLNPLKVWSTRP
jgi:hypothetical protein